MCSFLAARGSQRLADVLAAQFHAKRTLHLGEHLLIWDGLALFVVGDE
jgi:hypothetical protein